MIDPRNIEVIDDTYADALRKMPGIQRVHMAGKMFEFARDSLLHHLRNQHPGWTEAQVRREAIWRLTGVAI